MKHVRSPLAVLVAVAWTACVGSESGNPPVTEPRPPDGVLDVDLTLVRADVGADGDVTLTGEAGAALYSGADPAEAEVVVRNLSDAGTRYATSVNPDGSFALTLEAISGDRARFEAWVEGYPRAIGDHPVPSDGDPVIDPDDPLPGPGCLSSTPSVVVGRREFTATVNSSCDAPVVFGSPAAVDGSTVTVDVEAGESLAPGLSRVLRFDPPEAPSESLLEVPIDDTVHLFTVVAVE